MLDINFDGPERCVVMRVLPGKQSDKDWQRGLEIFLALDEEAARQDKDGIVFVIAEPGAERPNATWRRKLADQRKLYKAKKRYLILVTDSVLFRGVLYVVNLLSPPSDVEESFVAKTIEEGIAKAEEWRGQPIPLLRDLLKK